MDKKHLEGLLWSDFKIFQKGKLPKNYNDRENISKIHNYYSLRLLFYYSSKKLQIESLLCAESILKVFKKENFRKSLRLLFYRSLKNILRNH